MSVPRAFLLFAYLMAVAVSSSPGEEPPLSGPEMRDRMANRTVNGLTSSIVPNRHERVLMRRKRFLIFPKGANVICTLSMVKGLVFKSPRGYNLLAEVDYFYPLPDSVAALKPKRTKLKAVAPPATTTTTTEVPAPPPPHPIDEHELYFNHNFDHPHPDLFVPDSGWRDDPNLAHLPDAPVVPAAEAKDRVWTPQSTHFDPKLLFLQQQQQQQKPRLPVTSYWNGATANQWSYNQPPLQLRRIDYFPQGRALNVDKPEEEQEDGKTRKITEPPAGTRQTETTGSPSATASEHWTEHEDWEHFDAHRDRRDLYKSLEGMISGLNLQPCLLRTICEAQHFLLPRGQSLFHDIFKILFTLPIKDVFSDDYAEAMRTKADDCYERFARDCPISILHMFLNSERVI